MRRDGFGGAGRLPGGARTANRAARHDSARSARLPGRGLERDRLAVGRDVVAERDEDVALEHGDNERPVGEARDLEPARGVGDRRPTSKRVVQATPA